MNPPKKNLNRETILDTALLMIDETGGIKEVTLRAIAQRMGCAHTNLYNYFSSLEEIYWECVARILLLMIEDMGREDPDIPDPEEKLFGALLRMMDFSFDHLGWHRLVWLEPSKGSPPPQVIPALHQAPLFLAKVISEAGKGTLNESRVSQLLDILFAYLYGEINMWITRRNSAADRQKCKDNAYVNIRLIFRLIRDDAKTAEV